MDYFDSSEESSSNAVHLLDVKIMKVQYVTTAYEWLFPIINDLQQNLFPILETNPDTRWDLQRAMCRYRGQAVLFGDRTVKTDARTEEEPIDIETAVDAAGVEKSDVDFMPAYEKRFTSVMSTIGALARCVVECVVAKSGKQKVGNGDRVVAYVSGAWPILSDAVRYEIKCVPKQYGGQTQLPGARKDYDAAAIGCGIYPSSNVRATIGDFHSLLLHSCRLGDRPVNTIIQTMFPTVYSQPPREGVTVHKTIKGPGGQQQIDLRQPLLNEFDVVELRDILDRGGGATSWVNIDHKNVLFPTVAMFFYRAELARIAECYKTKNRWYEVLSRGCALVKHLSFLLNHAPHILNVKRLKYLDCVTQQNEFKQKKKRNYHNGSRLLLDLFDMYTASIRGLNLLPERTYAQFFETVMQNQYAKRDNVLPNKELATVATALDIYSVMQQDQNSAEKLYTDDTQFQRSKAVTTSGHMFSVIDSVPQNEVLDGDSSSSTGTIRLDDVQPLPNAPPPPPTTEASTSMNLDDDTNTLNIPSIHTSSTSSTTSVRSAYHTNCFNDFINRLTTPCNVDDFVIAMRWLIEKGVVTKVEMTGTSDHNRGKKFDAFYLSSVYALQSKCVATLGDLYKRGIKSSINRHEQMQSESYNIDDAQEEFRARSYMLEEKIAYFDEARQVLRALCVSHAELLKKIRNADRNVDLEAVVEDADGPVAQNTDVAKDEARLLSDFEAFYTDVKSFIAGTPDEIDKSDPYAELRPEPVDGERTTCFPLLIAPVVDNNSSNMTYCTEQQRAIKRMETSPLSIVVGGAGCGKTAVLEKATMSYHQSQVMVCSPYGKVVAELNRRVANARTIDSLLFAHRVLYQQEVQKAENILGSLRAAVRHSGFQNSPLARIVEIRADLYRILGVYDHPSPFENIRVLIVDESSLVNFKSFEALLSAIHQCKSRAGFYLERIILCGDQNQLQPIGYGSIIKDCIHAFPWCVHHMTINHRSHGTSIFNFAKSIVTKKLGTREAPMPLFGGDDNWLKLMVPLTFTADASMTPQQLQDARREFEEASLVFLQANKDTYPEIIARAFDMLGACDIPATPGTLAVREKILMIASTRKIVEHLNNITRSLFFRESIEKAMNDNSRFVTSAETGELQMPQEFQNRIVPGQRIILKKNFHKLFYVEEADEGSMFSNARIERLRNMAYERRIRKTRPMKKIVNYFYNGEQLTVIGFYDTPYFLRDTTWCRCGLCPPPCEDQTGQSTCMLEPHEVPIGRRVLANMNLPTTIKYHTQGMKFRDGGWAHDNGGLRRMAVFQVVNEPSSYKEVDVAEHLANLSQFAFAHAATIHTFQGSEAPIVFYVCPKDNPHIDPTAVYTGVTRAQRKLIIVGDRNVVMNTVQRQSPVRRSEFWALCALEANKFHRSLHDESDPLRLAKVLQIDDALTQSLINTTRDIEPVSRGELWRDYDKIKEQAYSGIE